MGISGANTIISSSNLGLHNSGCPHISHHILNCGSWLRILESIFIVAIGSWIRAYFLQIYGDFPWSSCTHHFCSNVWGTTCLPDFKTLAGSKFQETFPKESSQLYSSRLSRNIKWLEDSPSLEAHSSTLLHSILSTWSH